MANRAGKWDRVAYAGGVLYVRAPSELIALRVQ